MITWTRISKKKRKKKYFFGFVFFCFAMQNAEFKRQGNAFCKSVCISDCLYKLPLSEPLNRIAHPRAKWLVGINGILVSAQSIGDPWVVIKPQDAFASPGSASSWIAIAEVESPEKSHVHYLQIYLKDDATSEFLIVSLKSHLYSLLETFHISFLRKNNLSV